MRPTGVCPACGAPAHRFGRCLPDVLGTARFWWGLGQSYADGLRQGFVGSAIIGSAAKYLGLSAGWAVAVGGLAVVVWPCCALGAGYCIWKWKLVHQELTRQMEVNPAVTRQLDYLAEIARNTGPRSITVGSRCQVDGCPNPSTLFHAFSTCGHAVCKPHESDPCPVCRAAVVWEHPLKEPA